MNISLEKIDRVNALLTVNIDKADCQERIDKILKEEGKIEVECHFCGKKYDFGKEDFKNL